MTLDTDLLRNVSYYSTAIYLQNLDLKKLDSERRNKKQ